MKIEQDKVVEVIKEYWAESDGVLGYAYREELVGKIKAIGSEKP